MDLQASAYSEHQFYQEVVEEIRLVDADVYAGCRLHEELKTDEGEVVNRLLESETLSICGMVDWLSRRDGQLISYEHGHVRSAKKSDRPQA